MWRMHAAGLSVASVFSMPTSSNIFCRALASLGESV